jgi:hypothetical protein
MIYVERKSDKGKIENIDYAISYILSKIGNDKGEYDYPAVLLAYDSKWSTPRSRMDVEKQLRDLLSKIECDEEDFDIDKCIDEYLKDNQNELKRLNYKYRHLINAQEDEWQFVQDAEEQRRDYGRSN